MKKILFDIDYGNIWQRNPKLSNDFVEVRDKYSNLLMSNFSQYFNKKLGIGCLRIFITDYDLKVNEFKLGIDPEKDSKDLKALGILIFRINKNIDNWLELSQIEKYLFVKDIWKIFFNELPQIVYLENKNEVIRKLEEIQI